jgi:hypothetical protein
MSDRRSHPSADSTTRAEIDRRAIHAVANLLMAAFWFEHRLKNLSMLRPPGLFRRPPGASQLAVSEPSTLS